MAGIGDAVIPRLQHQIPEVKRLWAGIVLGWEVPVLHPFEKRGLYCSFILEYKSKVSNK
jgi:hypothetical protein